MVGEIVESEMSQQDLKHARSALDQFNGFFKAVAAASLPKSEDDIAHTKVSTTERSFELGAQIESDAR